MRNAACRETGGRRFLLYFYVFSEKAMEKVLKEEAEIEEIKKGKVFETVITATNKGGLTGQYGSYQVFVPSSQIKIGFVKDLEK